MPSRNFTTVSVRLIEYAEESINHFKTHGYRVDIEKRELGFPYTPTLFCRRQRTIILVEVNNRILYSRILDWVSYARSCNHDIRVAVCLSPKAIYSPEQENFLREKGVGLYKATGNGLIEVIPPSDLALGVHLPELSSLPRRLRSLLAPAYEQFDRSQWREGFEDACQAFETAARDYLKAGIRSTRITIMTNNGPKNPKPNRIEKMTLGQLADTFSRIQSPNRSDSIITQVLSSINRDRVGVVHHKLKATTERSLRANVGQHMWAIIQVMKIMS